MARRVMILYASVGTGHQAAAEALKSWFELEHPDTEATVRDVLGYTPRWVARCIVGSYLFMARSAPSLWGWLYRKTDKTSRHSWIWNFFHGILCKMYLSRLIKDIKDNEVEAIVATHFFALPALIKKMDFHIPLYYVNTDFMTHALQRYPSFAGWYVGCERAIDQYRAEGITVGVHCLGIPVAPVYSDPPKREECFSPLILDPSRPVVLLLGGGIGVGALEEITESFTAYPHIQLLVICGTHHQMEKKLKEKYYPFREYIRIMGFVDFMPHCYSVADLVILKPGGLCSAEALAMGRPLLLMEPLPGQERFNADYLLEQGVALRLYENRRAGWYVKELLKEPSLLQRLGQRSAQVGRPYAGKEIVNHLIAEMNSPKWEGHLYGQKNKSETISAAETPQEAQIKETSQEDCSEKNERE